MLTDEQEKFIFKCEMHVGSQPYSEVLRLIDIIKELQNDEKTRKIYCAAYLAASGNIVAGIVEATQKEAGNMLKVIDGLKEAFAAQENVEFG